MAELTEKEINQRQIAARKHGAYAFMARGSNALDVSGRSRLAELAELVESRQGVIGLLQERVVNAVLMCELIEGYLVTEDDNEKTIIDNAALKVLPAYMNSANRAIQALMKELPGDSAPANAEMIRIQKVIDEHAKDTR